MSGATIARWVAAGRLHRKYRGVYAYGHPRLSREGEWMAAVLAAGEGAALAGLSAAVLLGITKWTEPEIEVIVPANRRPRGEFRVRLCRNLDPLDVTEVDGIPVTTVARTLVDLTDDLEADELAQLIHEAAYKRKFSLAATRAAIKRANGQWRLRVLEEALEMHLSGSAGTRSRLERRFKRLVRGAGLPEPRTNVLINGFEVDFYWPGLCVEIDGAGHARPRAQVDDRIRDAALRAAGYVVLRFAEEDLDIRPGWVLDQLTAQQLARGVAA